MNYLIGVDNGGTFTKAAIFDEFGHQIAVSSGSVSAINPQPGYAERDMHELWEVNSKVIRDCVVKSGIDPEHIKGISFSGHGKGLYLVDNDGKPLYNGILSTDNRAWQLVERWKNDGTADRIYKKSFQAILSCQPVSLLAWLKENDASTYEKIKYVFSVNDYIRYCMTGAANMDYTIASGGNLVNLTTGAYDYELLQEFGIADIYEKLPPLMYPAEVCGFVSKQAAEETGLLAGMPVATGMFDINACGIAAGLVDTSELCMIAGTWSINEYITNKPVVNGTVALNSMYCIPELFLVEESSPTSAGNMEWFIRNIMDCEKARADKEHTSIYDLTNKWVSEIEPQDNSIIFLPFLNGSGEDPLARGTFIGISGYHNKKHMLRAVYEGVVFSHLSHVQKLLRNRSTPSAIRLAGGAANSPVWVQMFADALQIPIDTVEDKELGAQGAAIAAGIASGLYENYKTAVQKTMKITKRIYPRTEYKVVYEKKFAAYRQVIECLKGKWGEMF